MNTSMTGDSFDSRLDQLRAEWTQRDQRLDSVLKDISVMLNDARLRQGREAIRKAGRIHWVENVVSVAFIVMLARFNVHHWSDWSLLLPGAALQIWVTVMFAIGVHEQMSVRNLDFSLPVGVLQSRIEKLAIARFRTFKWAFLTGQVLWYVPFLLVLFKGLFGINLYAISPDMPRFVWLNVLGGIAAIPLLLWLSHAVGKRFAGSSLLRRLVDGLAGRDIAAAREFLAELNRT